ncbi:hypothetical protein GW17_00046548 [Ensete ventricosum]|nr:hypothetical protein GW17_00046548 [Ensete ventricosum]
MYQVDAVGNLPGVHRKLAEGIESLPGWHKGVCQKKTETRQKIVRGSRKICRDSDDEVGSRRKLLGDSSKELGSSLGTQREIAGKKTRGLTVRLPEVAGLCGS